MYIASLNTILLLSQSAALVPITHEFVTDSRIFVRDLCAISVPVAGKFVAGFRMFITP